MPSKPKKTKASASSPFSVLGAADKIKDRKKKTCQASGGSWDNQAGKCK